ncbi:MAG: PQQ-binding-like beta-propeller repeat protein [Chloroflexi bacterium]|nr:PQQ-binding-like beta-propeller repeat protein [Chloroflexota bacterium]
MRMKYDDSISECGTCSEIAEGLRIVDFNHVLKWVGRLVIFLLLWGFIISCSDQESVEVEQVEDNEAVPEVEPAELEQQAEEPEAIETHLVGENLVMAWTYNAGGPINHPPLRIGDIVIAVAEKGALFALDAKTGAVRWQYDPPQRIWDRAYTSNGRFLFVGIEGGKLVALDVETGAVQWEKELGIDTQIPALIAEDILYVSTTFVGPGLSNDPTGKAKLFALSTSDGSEQWVFESDNYILQTPFIVGEDLYLAGLFDDPEPIDEGGHTRLYALSTTDGTINWTYESEDGFPKSVYATETAVSFIGYQDFANGIDTKTGQLLWRKDTGNWVPTLTGVDNTIYFGSANTIVHALDMDDGHVVWQHNIEEGTFNYILGAPIIIEDDFIFLSQHGNIMSLNVHDGTLRWQFPTGITSRTGLSVFGNWLYIGDQDGIVYAYTSP